MAKLVLAPLRLPLLSLLLFVIVAAVLQRPRAAQAANVLAVLPSVWTSHYLFGKRLLEQLASKHNHSVTLISPHAADTPSAHAAGSGDDARRSPHEPHLSEPPNIKIREIRVEGLLENWLEMGLSFDVEQIRLKSVMERFTRLIYAGTTNSDLLLSDAQVRKLLRSGEQFDLLVIDLFLSDSLLGLAHYYQMPTVVISPTGANTWLNQMLGNPQSAAFDPSNFLPYRERMDFWERCLNMLMGIFEKLTYNFFHMISQQAVYAKHFQPLSQLANVTLPHHRELTKNLSLVLLNSHPVVQYPRAYLPNMLPVAGLHLQQSPTPLTLPNHLRDFIEAAPHSVVYMSLGADARTADLSRERLDAFLDVFSYLRDMRFLLKWELEDFDADLPNNVMINEWFPQQAILAHSHVKVFISAGGLMSTIEAIDGLTPLLLVPLSTEQEVNARRLEAHGVAATVAFDAIAYDAILHAVLTLTENNSYAKQMWMLRERLRGDYGSPVERALHHIQLVLETGGADFLKSHANELSFARAELIDVLLVIGLGLFGIIAVPFLVTSCILRRSYQSYQANGSHSMLAHHRAVLKDRSGAYLTAAACAAGAGDAGVKRARTTSTASDTSSGSSSSSRPASSTSSLSNSSKSSLYDSPRATPAESRRRRVANDDEEEKWHSVLMERFTLPYSVLLKDSSQ